MSAALLFQAARLLEQDDALVNSRNASSQTPLHAAVAKSLLHMVQLLLSYGADVGARTEARFGGLTPLHVAARYDLVDVGRALVQAGAPPNARALGSDATPLHECARFGSTAMLQWLLSIPGVDGAATDSAGFAAAYYAKKAGHVALAKMLPQVKYDLWNQLKGEPHYAANLAAVQETIEKKEKIAARKLEALEKKKKKKPF